MSAFQLVTIFAILAIVSGFSPSRATYGKQIKVSTTQIYEVSLSIILMMVAALEKLSLCFVWDGSCKWTAPLLKGRWQYLRFWEVIFFRTLFQFVQDFNMDFMKPDFNPKIITQREIFSEKQLREFTVRIMPVFDLRVMYIRIDISSIPAGHILRRF